MISRRNQLLKIQLLKRQKTRFFLVRYDIVVTRYRSHPNSRLDKIGSIGTYSKASIVKLDLKKLYNYLATRKVCISIPVSKVLNLDWGIVDGVSKHIHKTNDRESSF